jgi:transposase
MAEPVLLEAGCNSATGNIFILTEPHMLNLERASGMDIHKDNITACILTSNGKEIQTFSTKTVFLLQLIDWIKQHECTHIAMESTGVFWNPIVNLLEAEEIEFLVVNAQHMKAVPLLLKIG